MRLSRSLTVALGLVVALALAACADTGDTADDATDDEVELDDDPDADPDTDDTADTDDADGGVATGFEDCVGDPAGCNAGEPEAGGTVTWVIDQSPDSWFAMTPEGGSVYLVQTLQGVVPHTGGWSAEDNEYEFNMDVLAEEPELISEDPFTFEMHLHPDAVWDDGTPMTADDMIMTWWMNTSEEEGYCEGCRPRLTAAADNVESMESSDDGKTLTVTYKEGLADPEWFGWFSVELTSGGFFPRHVGEEEGFDLDDPAGVGEYFEFLNDEMPAWSGGPYRIESGDLDTQVLKVPNEEYWGEETPLDTLIVQFIEDEGSWVPALDNNEIDGAAPAQFNEDVYTQLEERPDVNLGVQPGPSWEHLDVNLDHPQLADVALRRAILTAVNIADMAERNYGSVFPDYTLRTNHMFDESSEYHEDLLEGTGYGTGDVEAAQDILAEAGYEGFDGSGLTLDGEAIGPFRLRATPTGVRPTSMELMQAHLAEIGVDVQIETTSDLGGTLAEQDYDLMMYGWCGSPFFTASPFQQWHSTSANNFAAYSDPDVDEMAEEASVVPSLDEAAELANGAARIVVEDAYVLPLWDTPVYIFANDEIVNVRDNTNTSLRAHANNHEWGLAAE